MQTVAVLGGGIGGLSAAYYLTRSPQVNKVVLLEAGSRFGGWLWSCRRPDGAVFELGPRGVRTAGAVGRNTLNMVEDVGLKGAVLPVSYSHIAAQNRFLYVNKQLNKMPSGLGGVIRTVPPFSRPLLLSAALEVFVRKSSKEDETIHSFITRRLGQELADTAIDSLCRGVFAGDSTKLSVRSCFPPLYNTEKHRGSILLGMLLGTGPDADVPAGPLAQQARHESWAQWSLRQGMESLPEALSDWLAQNGRVELHRHTPVKQLRPTVSGWEIQLHDGTISADHIISALPAKDLLSVLPPSLLPLSLLLQDIATVTVAVVNLEYEGSILPVTGFGHLLPSSEERGILGVVYDSVAFPEHNRPTGLTTRLTVMMGGAWFQEVFGAPEEVTEDSILATATNAVHRHLGVTTAPSWSMVTVHRDCIPQYYLGHWKRVESMRGFIKDKLLPLTLVGSSFDGVSVNDVIFSGRKAAEGLLGHGV